MREALSRYIRSLTEQEQPGGAPEHRQDLGTFVDWLLERRGFVIHVRTFKHEGLARTKNSGKLQHGVDIIGEKADADGQPRLYLFVLKTGKIGISEWTPDVRGSMIHDLGLAADRNGVTNAWLALRDERFERTTIVAVHNGDLDRESLASHVNELKHRIERIPGFTLEWWDANRLIDLALEPQPDHEASDLRHVSDASLFPPGVRPFARAALDSFRLTGGFDVDAVERLLEEVLPLDRAHDGRGPGARLEEGRSLEARLLRRSLNELALFAKMVEVDSRGFAEGSTLPVLSTIERISCRVMEHVRRIPHEALGDHRAPIQGLLRGLVESYVDRAEHLLRRLEPLRSAVNGLAVPSLSEPIDYPLRALTLGGYLGTAGLASLFDARADGVQRARNIARALHDLWTHNPGGFGSPVTDDQIIELSLIWELWLRVGMRKEVAWAASELLERLLVRKASGLPLPALYQRAHFPMKEEHVGVLVEAHLRAPPPPAFEDRGSTIAPLAVFLAAAGGRASDEHLQRLAEPRLRTPYVGGATEHLNRPIYLQSWMPPEDAASEWYAHEVEHRGFVHVFDVSSRGASGLVEKFRAFNRPIPKSPAEAWDLPILDRMAWKLWRTPPPMAVLIHALEG